MQIGIKCSGTCIQNVTVEPTSLSVSLKIKEMTERTKNCFLKIPIHLFPVAATVPEEDTCRGKVGFGSWFQRFQLVATWSPSGFRGFSSWLLGLTVSGPGVRQHITVGARSQAGLLISSAARKQRGEGMAPNNPFKDTHQPSLPPWTPPQFSTTSQQCTGSQPGFQCRLLSRPRPTNCLNMSHCLAFVFSESTDLSS